MNLLICLLRHPWRTLLIGAALIAAAVYLPPELAYYRDLEFDRAFGQNLFRLPDAQIDEQGRIIEPDHIPLPDEEFKKPKNQQHFKNAKALEPWVGRARWLALPGALLALLAVGRLLGYIPAPKPLRHLSDEYEIVEVIQRPAPQPSPEPKKENKTDATA